MGELAQAMRMFSGNMGCHVLQFPSGKWGFVGSVPVQLAMTGPAEDIEKARRFGKGLYPSVKTRVWETKEEALATAKELGVTVTNG